jgi:hypothetical protein
MDMIILNRQNKPAIENPQYGRLNPLVRVFLYGLLVLTTSPVVAQVLEQEPQQAPLSVQTPVEEIAVVVSHPDSKQMVMALATPELRKQALLDLAVAANVLSRAESEFKEGIEIDHAALAQSYLDDRAWLQTLIDRYGWVQPHSSVIDPAAWQLIDELQRNDFENMPLLFPGRMPEAGLIFQVFKRSGQSLASANLPSLLLEVESNVFTLWDAFLLLTQVEGVSDTAWKAVETAWFTDRQIPAPFVSEASSQNQVPWLEKVTQALSETVRSAVEARPPDSIGLTDFRYSILSGLPQLAGEENFHTLNQAKDSLYMLSLIDGLHEGRYFEFVQGLLSITFRLLELTVNGLATFSLAGR